MIDVEQQGSTFSAINYSWWDSNDVCFVLGGQIEFEFYTYSSQSIGRHADLFEQASMIFETSQSMP